MHRKIPASFVGVLALMTQARTLPAAYVNSTCSTLELEPIDSGWRLIVTGCTSEPPALELNHVIGNHSGITEVTFTNSKLKQIPDVICEQMAIRSLNLSHNLLTDFPQCLESMRNLTALDLSHNHIAEIRGDDVTGLDQLEQLHLEYNKITVTEFEAWANFNKSQIEIITLNHNAIKSLPRRISKLSFDSLQQLDLSYNNFLCDCQDKWMKPWLERFQGKLINEEEILCSNSATGGPFPLLKIRDMDKFTCDQTVASRYRDDLTEILISFVVVVTILPFIAGAVVYGVWRKRRLIFHKTRWHPFDVDNCVNEGKQYDVFISCASQDEEWCTKNVVDFLQDRNYKVCWHGEHVQPARPVLSDVTNDVTSGINDSKRALCVLSKYYTDSPTRMRELEAAVALDAAKNKERTIIVKSKDVDAFQLHPQVQRYLKNCFYLERGTRQFYDNFLYALPTKTMDGSSRDYEVVVRDDIPLEERAA